MKAILATERKPRRSAKDELTFEGMSTNHSVTQSRIFLNDAFY